MSESQACFLVDIITYNCLGYKLISVRIREDTLSALDKMAAETRYSRNELINLILEHGVKNIIIE